MRHSGAFERIEHRIQYFRKERKLSQEKLAELSHISLSYMSKIERADLESFSVITLLDIAEALNVPASALLVEDNI